MLVFMLWLVSLLAWALPELDPNQKYNYTYETWVDEIHKTYPLVPCIDTDNLTFLHPLEEIDSTDTSPNIQSHTRKVCGWFQVHFDEIADDGSQFEINAYIDAEGYYQIIGNKELWPLNVKKNGVNIIVTERDSQPYIYLNRGEVKITGSFAWNQEPPYIKVPKHFFILPNKDLENSIREGNLLYLHKDHSTREFESLYTLHHMMGEQPNICNNTYVFSGYTGEVQISLPADEILEFNSIFPYSTAISEDKITITIREVYGSHVVQIRQVVPSVSSYLQQISIELEEQPQILERWLVIDQDSPLIQVSTKGMKKRVVHSIPTHLEKFIKYTDSNTTIDHSQQIIFIEQKEQVELVRKAIKRKVSTSNYMQRSAWWNPSRQNWILHDYIQARNSENRLYTTELIIEEIQAPSGLLSLNTYPQNAGNEEVQVGTELRFDEIEVVVKATTKDAFIPNSGYNIQFEETKLIRFIPKDHKVISLYALSDWKIFQIILCIIVAILTPQISFIQRGMLGGIFCASLYTQAPWIILFLLVGILMQFQKDWSRGIAHILIWIALLTYALIEIDMLHWNNNIGEDDTTSYVQLSEEYGNPYELLDYRDSSVAVGNDIPSWSDNRVLHSVTAMDRYKQEIILPPQMWFPIFIFHLCLLLYISYRFYGLEIPNFSKRKEVLLALFILSFASDAHAEPLMGYELQQIKEDFYKGHCKKNCSSTSFMRIDADNGQLTITAEVHVNKRTMWKIPGPEEQWMPRHVFVDNKETTKLFRYEIDKQGHYYLLLLEEGVWEIKIKGQLKQATVLTLHENSKSLDFNSSQWEIHGISQPIYSPQNIYIYPTEKQSHFENFTSKLHLTRHIKTTPKLKITNTLRRIGERSNTKISVNVPQHLITTNEQENQTTREITSPINKTELTWEEELSDNLIQKSEERTHLYLSSDSGFYETWILECATSHHCSAIDNSIDTITDGDKQIWYPRTNQNMDIEIIALEPLNKNWRMRDTSTKIHTENYNDPYLRWETSSNVYSTKDQSISFTLGESADCKVTKFDEEQILKRQGRTIFVDINKGINPIRLSCLSPKQSLYWYSMPIIQSEQELQGHRLTVSDLSWIPITISKNTIKGDQKHYIAYVFLFLFLSIFCAKLSFSSLRLFEWLSVLLIALFYNYHLSMAVLFLLFLWNLLSLSSSKENLRWFMIILWYVIPSLLMFSFLYIDRIRPQFLSPYPTVNLTDQIYFLSLPFRSRFLPPILITIVLIRWMTQRRNYPKER